MTVISAVSSTSTDSRSAGFVDDDPRQEVAVRILLPVEKVLRRLDLERVAEHRRAAVGGGPQADDLRAELDQLS